jgi:hypothetical protein
MIRRPGPKLPTFLVDCFRARQALLSGNHQSSLPAMFASSPERERPSCCGQEGTPACLGLTAIAGQIPTANVALVTPDASAAALRAGIPIGSARCYDYHSWNVTDQTHAWVMGRLRFRYCPGLVSQVKTDPPILSCRGAKKMLMGLGRRHMEYSTTHRKTKRIDSTFATTEGWKLLASDDRFKALSADGKERSASNEGSGTQS